MLKRDLYLITAMACMLCFCSWYMKRQFTLFILGDSISLQYGSYLEKQLGAAVQVQRKGSQETAMRNLDVPIDANGGDSRMVLSYLRTREKDEAFKPDLLLLNCGLHDIKRNPTTGKIAVDTAEYRSNLNAIYALLAGKKRPVIWVRTTEVIDSVHAAKSKAFSRFSRDVNVYNAIADDVCGKYQIPAIDLYSFTLTLGDDRFADHVHYIPRVVQRQAGYIAEYLQQWRKEHKK